MTPSFSRMDWPRSRLVVLSDRRPAPGAPRTGIEPAIEWALREHDGVWLARHPDAEPPSAPGETGARDGAWSVLGGGPAGARSSLEEWTGYVRSNTSYAERIIEAISPGGTVWINGHHWLLVPAALREHGHRGPIGLLLDEPFPAPARFEALPWHGDVMAAMCQLDLVGFWTPECAARFETCRGPAGQRRPWSGIFPNGVESARVDPAAWGTHFLHVLATAARRGPQHAACSSLGSWPSSSSTS